MGQQHRLSKLTLVAGSSVDCRQPTFGGEGTGRTVVHHVNPDEDPPPHIGHADSIAQQPLQQVETASLSQGL